MIQRTYDCTKAKDFIHEWFRYQDYLDAEGYPNPGPYQIVFGAEDVIERLQKWSDENPDVDLPKLTAEERAFVSAFKVKESKRIERRHGKVYVVSMYGSQEFEIWPSLFKFIGEGEHVPLTELMQLEVEDE